MDKNIIEQLKVRLESGKQALEKELASFAVEDKNLKDNWDVKPLNNEDSDMEEKADELQEYDNLLSVEHSLELRLRDINLALEKMGKNEYGNCEKCSKEIEAERLQAIPEAKLCMKCNTAA
ncbi:MAG: TraR/DksA C4-type zinc finger protein [bacterium]|nr:TraR/DksA C4-type zinc finger protein [bacterium]